MIFSFAKKIKIDKKFLKNSFLIIFFIFFIKYAYIKAATTEEINSQIQKITDNKSLLEKEIAAYEEQIEDIGEQANSLKSAIKSLDATIKKNSLDIKLTENNINQTELQIKELSLGINKNNDLINQNIRAISKLLVEINKYDSSSLLENLLMYDDLSEFWNEEQNISIIQDEIRQRTYEVKDEKTSLENNKTKTEKKKKELLSYKSSLLDQKKVLDIAKKEKNKLLADTKNSEANYKKILEEKKTLADAFDKELEMFESQLKFNVDPKSVPSAIRGTLNWPLSSIYITSPFGVRWGRNHNGTDFRASIGTPVKNPLSGVVKGTGDTDTACPKASLGKWILIEHSNGLSTLYAHLSLIKVSAGQYVSTGDVIAYSGNTGVSTGPHLHFGVLATQGVKIMDYPSKVCNATYHMPVGNTGSYLDPMTYLPLL